MSAFGLLAAAQKDSVAFNTLEFIKNSSRQTLWAQTV